MPSTAPDRSYMKKEKIKINLGSGRVKKGGYVNIDKVQIVGSNGKITVDNVMDIETTPLPYGDNTVSEILADNILEHVDKLEYVLNECWRVLKIGGRLVGVVPKAGTDKDFRDPTHKRHFTKNTFSYFTGKSAFMENRPAHPKYADYGFYPWELEKLEEKDDLFYFTLIPNKNITL